MTNLSHILPRAHSGASQWICKLFSIVKSTIAVEMYPFIGHFFTLNGLKVVRQLRKSSILE